MRDYGTVNYNGKTYTLEQDAYCSDSGETYQASATHPDYPDATIYVIWDNLHAGHICDGDGNCVIDGCNGECEDESNACDWDNPSAVKIDGEHVEAIEARKAAAAAMGASRTPAKQAASRANGQRGGRPKKTA